MCLSPITVPSKKRYFVRNSWESYYNSFPCGQCAECRQNRELDEYVRCMYETKFCFGELKGYAIFDTLSYDDTNLPHVSDIFSDFGMDRNVPAYFNMSCFRLADWRGFVTRLNARIAGFLKRKYGRSWRKVLVNNGLYNPKYGLFNYLMASEYGSDKMYVDDKGRTRYATARPHYHVLFFSYLPKEILLPEMFSHFVDKCWKKGRTDGWMYKTKKHSTIKEWYSVRVFESLNSDFLTGVMNVLKYVAKYIGKDQDFEMDFEEEEESSINKFGSIERNIFQIMFPYYDFDDLWKLRSGDYESFKKWKRFKRNLYNFSKKGHGFGSYFIDWIQSGSPDAVKMFNQVCSKGFMYLPMNDNQKIYRHSLPSYYARKLFSEQYRDKDGHLRWRPSVLGLKFKRSQIVSSIDNLKSKMRLFVDTSNDPFVLELKNQYGDLIDKVIGTTVCWYRLYEGRIIPDYIKIGSDYKYDLSDFPQPAEMIDYIVGNYEESADSDFVSDILSSDQYEGYVLYNYNTPRDIAFFGRSMLVDRNLGNPDDGFRVNTTYKSGWNMREDRYFPFKFPYGFKVSEMEGFSLFSVAHARLIRGFSKVEALWNCYQNKRIKDSEEKQRTYEKLKEERRRQKMLGISN